MAGEYSNKVSDALEKIEDDVKKVLNILTSVEDTDDMEEIKESVLESIILLSELKEKL
jgi:hypothetical protein